MTQTADEHEFTEVERYELRERPRYRFDTNRREFVQVVGSGLMIGVAAKRLPAQRRAGGRGGRGDRSRRAELLSQRFHFDADGTVTIFTSKVEVGQGSRTQITQAVAEELQLPLERIKVVMADTQLCPDDGGTAGSRTTPSTIPRVRAAAAAARDVLVGLAAKHWGVDRSTVKYEAGELSESNSQNRMSWATLLEDPGFAASLDQPPGEDARQVDVADWRVLGRSAPKVGAREIVTGAHRYASDITQPGMLYGKVLRPSSLGATLQAVDLDAAKAVSSDVHVVRDGDFVACAAGNSWIAQKAIDAIAQTAQWDAPSHPSSRQLFDHLKRTARTRSEGWPSPRTDGWGDLGEGLAAAKARFEAAYTVAYIQHAPMEPRAAVAQWSDGGVTVWTGSQQPSRVRSQVAESLRVPEERVRVIVPDTGGGFGGKHSGEAAVEAARLARGAGRPVSLRWTREEEFTWAYCRPAGLIEVEAGLDDQSRLVAWSFTNYNSGGSAIDTPYTIPHGQTQFLASDSPLRQGSYRALASTANTFARESAMDELAAMARIDPLQFRLAHLPDGRLRDVLQAAAKRFDWPTQRASRREGRGVGLACGTEKGSYVAACAEVEVDGDTIHVKRVCQAYECGKIQNPANLQAQVEGCIIMGLGGALSEQMIFEGGKITNPRFSQYQVPRIDDVPELDILLIDRPDLASVGAGETPIIAVAPAIANAVFHATGRRLRSMPMTAS
jgi:isoquinoline 1-oxidoreductase